MIRKILVASTALAAIAAFSVATEPVNARGSCVVLAAKGRGVDEAKTSARSLKHLTNKINHYAHKNKLSSVRVGFKVDRLLQDGRPRRLQKLSQSVRLGVCPIRLAKARSVTQ
jgi:hypothetical protein